MRILFLLLLSFNLSAQTLFFSQGKPTQPTPTPDPPITGGLHVAKTGDDSDPCTFAEPCLTGQRAANIAQPGDTVFFHVGTYRESINPPNSGISGDPIVFTNYPGDIVIISGLEDVGETGWSVHSGDIYKKTIALPSLVGTITGNTTLLDHQIFKNGEMQFEASSRVLDTFEDLFDLYKWKYLGGSGGVNFQPTSLTDAALSGLGLSGGTVVTIGWFQAHSKTITNHTGNTITYGQIWDNSGGGKNMRKYYFVTKKLSLLNRAREWFYDGTTLYYQQPGGGSPTQLTYKARNWGFNLSNKSHISIYGNNIGGGRFRFFGVDAVKTSVSSSNITIDGIDSWYPNWNVRHEVVRWQGYGVAQQVGITLIGPNSVIKNSRIRFSGSQGVWIGAGNRGENNYFDYISASGNWGAPFTLWGDNNINGIVLTGNTAKHLGRGCFDNGMSWIQATSQSTPTIKTLNNEYSYNDVSYACMLNQDGSMFFYSWAWQDTGGCRVHHNWVHDLGAKKPPDGSLTDGLMSGIYYGDQGSGPDIGGLPLTIDHNVVWNMGNTGGWTSTELNDLYNLPSYEVKTKRSSQIYNNTLYGDIKSYVTYQTNVADIMRNNIFRREVNLSWGAAPSNISNCLMQTTNALLTGGSFSTPQIYFVPQASSPAVNAGVSLPPYTDGSVGAPDIGAYERGGVAWVAGCSGPLCSDTP